MRRLPKRGREGPTRIFQKALKCGDLQKSATVVATKSFQTCAANQRIGHAASREARAYLQKSWEQLTSDRYDRETGCHEKNLVDPYRGSWLTYWRVLLDPRYDPQNIDPAIIEILAAAWNSMETANRMKFLMEQARFATGQNEIVADFVSAKLNASWIELSADQRLYFLEKYSSWAPIDTSMNCLS